MIHMGTYISVTLNFDGPSTPCRQSSICSYSKPIEVTSISQRNDKVTQHEKKGHLLPFAPVPISRRAAFFERARYRSYLCMYGALASYKKGRRHSPIRAIGFDGTTTSIDCRSRSTSIVSKHELQMFALAFAIVLPHQDPHRRFVSLQLRDAATGVLQLLGRTGVHCERSDFGDGVPCRGALTCVTSGISTAA